MENLICLLATVRTLKFQALNFKSKMSIDIGPSMAQ